MEGVIKRESNKEQIGYSVLYQTPQTQELDTFFGLTGEPVDPKLLICRFMPMGYERREQENCMSHFPFVAAQFGNFVGISLDEIVEVTKGRISEHDLLDSVEEGWLELFKYEDISVVAPTTKSKPFDVKRK